MLDRLPIASLQLAGLALLLLALGRLPGKWRAWGWRLALVKGTMLILGAIALPWLASEVVPGIPETPFFPVEEVVPSGTLAAAAEESVNWLLWSWLGGAAFVLTRLVWRATKRIHDLGPLPSEWVVTESAGVPVRVSPSVAAPMIVGIFRPCIVLPTWDTPPVGWEAAVAHEQAHARRRDLVWDAVVQGLAALFWFHPAAWLAVREHRLACEEACDAEAIWATGGLPRDYALTLVQLGRPTSAGLALGAPARALRRRIQAMHRRTLSARWALPFLVLATLVAIPLELTAEPLASDALPVSSFDHVASGMVGRPSIRKELGLNEETLRNAHDASHTQFFQIRVIAAKLEAMKRQGVPVKDRIAYENRAKGRYYSDVSKAILNHLTPAQKSRLREVALQRYGPLALAVPEIAKASKVADHTAQKIAQMRNDLNREMTAIQQADFRRLRDLRESGFGLTPEERKRRDDLKSQPMGPTEWNEFTKLEDKISKALGLPRINPNLDLDCRVWARYSALAEAALTPEERRAWKALLGRPLPVAPNEAILY